MKKISEKLDHAYRQLNVAFANVDRELSRAQNIIEILRIEHEEDARKMQTYLASLLRLEGSPLVRGGCNDSFKDEANFNESI